MAYGAPAPPVSFPTMLSPKEKQRRMAAYYQEQTKIILRDGWFIQGVFPTESEPGVCFSYTIGLTAAGLPELMIVGNIDFQIQRSLLNAAAAQHLENEINDGDEVCLADVNVPFRARLCGPDAPVQQARNRYGNKVRVIQLIWPDDKDNYPPDEGFERGEERQPLY